MGITSAATSPQWLHTMAQAASTLLLLELLVALVVVLALVGGLAYAAWWTHRNVLPVVGQYGLQAQQVIGMATRGSEAVVERVATFNGLRKAVVTGVRVFFLGKTRPEAEVALLGSQVRQPQPVASTAPIRGRVPTETVATQVTPESISDVQTAAAPEEPRTRNETRRGEPPLFNAPA